MDQTNTLPAILEWKAPNQTDHDRSANWYTIAGCTTLIMIVYGLLVNDWSMSIVIALAAGLYFLVRNKKHSLHTIRILDTGIEFDGKTDSWSAFKSFWLLQGPTHTELHIERKGLKSDILIFLNEIPSQAVFETLSAHLPHDPEKREKIFDAIIRFCKI